MSVCISDITPKERMRQRHVRLSYPEVIDRFATASLSSMVSFRVNPADRLQALNYPEPPEIVNRFGSDLALIIAAPSTVFIGLPTQKRFETSRRTYSQFEQDGFME